MKLTKSDAVNLAAILAAAQGNRRVARLVDGRVVEGEARSIGDENGNFLSEEDDVRDGYLRVTGGVIGMDYFWPIKELMDETYMGTFIPDAAYIDTGVRVTGSTGVQIGHGNSQNITY